MESIPKFEFRPELKFKPTPQKVPIFPEFQGFILYNVFTKKECEQIIGLGEAYGFQSLKGSYDPSYRNNQRIICEIPTFLTELQNRIFPFIDNKLFINHKTDTLFSNFLTTGVWEKSDLNPRFRLCKYHPNNFFKKHFDEGFHPDVKRKRTMKTCMLYLNEDFQGGETVFYYKNQKYNIQPKTGMCLIFDQQILHEGTVVMSGLKYFVRTDIYYNIVKNIQTNKYTKAQLNALEEFTKYVCECDNNNDEIALEHYKKAIKICSNVETLYYNPNSQFPLETS